MLLTEKRSFNRYIFLWKESVLRMEALKYHQTYKQDKRVRFYVISYTTEEGSSCLLI